MSATYPCTSRGAAVTSDAVPKDLDRIIDAALDRGAEVLWDDAGHRAPMQVTADRVENVVPSGWESESIGKKILVDWNASREARRAVADALPFLVAASSVTLLVVDSNKRADRHGEEPGADIALYLARLGAHVEVEQVSSRGSPVADIILSCAADHGADLIVIGAYSHPRSVEMVFGGVTRTLLREASIPVLMSR